ncbi:MAG TPA: phosphatidate cytidylyltransferase, partial [Acidimicrobiia bacterium]|nr:phosphatidate cytidylyltransferase [Acidimicrobiia bacterium]
PQPRYRDVDSDWEDDDDGGVGHLADDGGDDEAVLPTRGGIAGPRPEEDDDEAFERQVEERRRMARPGRADVPSPAPPVPPTPPPTAPPAAGRPAASAPPGRPGPGRPPVPGRPRPVGRPPGEGMLEPGMPEPTPLAPKGDERDLTKAIVTGVAMGVAALLLFSWGRGPAAWLVAIVAAMATAEVYAALRARGYRPATPVGLAGTAGLVLAGYDRGFEAFPLVMALVAVTTFVWFLIRAEDARPTVNIAMTFLPFLYVGTLAGFGGLLLAFPNGVGMLLGVIITAVVYDVFGYAVGSQVGTRRVAPAISPNKTVEGLIAGMVGSLLAGLIIVRMIHPWDIGSALWLGLLVGLSAPLGDFLESMLKRDMGIKDFSSLIPGHGGVMDRFDAILLSLPVAFYLVRVLDLF